MSLLTKNQPLVIDNENPFKDDCLGRKTSIENLTTLVQSLTQPFVISLEAPWGHGKTTYIKMWQQYLTNMNHPSLYFNAWENDYADDPLIAFLGEMNKLLEADKFKGNKANFRKSLTKVQEFGGKIIKKALPLTVQIVTQGIISKEVVKDLPNLLAESNDEIATALGEYTKNSIKSYELEKNSIGVFRDELKKFAEMISSESGKKPLVIFVDELDRCRPNYAIVLLERIKHLFNVPGVVFILSLDRKQLENAVAAIYGNKIDSSGYLARFIDYRFRLPEGTTENFVNYLNKRFSLDKVFDQKLASGGNNNEEDEFIRYVKKYFSIYGLSLRSQEQCFTEMNVVLRLVPGKVNIFPILLALLVTIKIVDPEIYEKFAQKNISPEELINSMPSSQLKEEYLSSYNGGYLEGLLYRYLCSENQQSQKIQEYIEIRDTGINMRENLVTKDRIRGFLGVTESERFVYRLTAFIDLLIKKLSIIDEITIQ